MDPQATDTEDDYPSTELVLQELDHGASNCESECQSLQATKQLTFIATGAVVRPCEKAFLHNLTIELGVQLQQMAYAMIQSKNIIEEVPPEALVQAQSVQYLLNQCRRLLRSPRLFPSDDDRSLFLRRLKIQLRLLPELGRINRFIEDFKLLGRSHCFDQEVPIKFRKIGQTWFKLRYPVQRRLSAMHPHGPSQKKPWNKWFDNRCRDRTVIQQHIPTVGIRMLRRWRMMYRRFRHRIEAVRVHLYMVEYSC